MGSSACSGSWRGAHVLTAATILRSAAGGLNDTLAECNVTSPPVYGNIGDCNHTLPSGGTCQPGCNSGHTPSGPAECSNGNLSAVTCLPSPCNMSEAEPPEHGEHGPECLTSELLESGADCRPRCHANHSLVSDSRCHYGAFTAGVCKLCPAGREFNASERLCAQCPAGTYKAVQGDSHCLSCPLGSDSTEGADTGWRCLCNSSTYRVNERSDGQPFSCTPCPEHARVRPGHEGWNVRDCDCVEPYDKPVLNETTQELLRCRLPRPCNLSGFLAEMELIGEEDYQMRLGTCENFVNSTGLPSGEVCHLACPERSAPQLHADFFRAINRIVVCEDGEIVQAPPVGTWCSEASWEVPPLIFLSAVTAATAVAMCTLEWRQHNFEQSCARALEQRLPPGVPGVHVQGAKCKVA